MPTVSSNKKSRPWGLVLAVSAFALVSIVIAHSTWGRYGGISVAVLWIILGSALEFFGQFKEASRQAEAPHGIEVGDTCTVVSGFSGSGSGAVNVSGETWAAVAADDQSAGATSGDSVTIVGRDGLRLLVRYGANDT